MDHQRAVTSPSPFPRRSRLVFLILSLVSAIFFFRGLPFKLPELSIMKSKPIPEIYGLIHLVSGSASLSQVESLDVSQPIPLGVYAQAETYDWKEERRRIDSEYPIVVFSKSYCPFSRRAKMLLQSYDLSPPPMVIEVDLRDDSLEVKQILTRLTDHSTFPNVVVQGTSLGGSDDVHALHSDGSLKEIFRKARVIVNGDV